MFHIYVENIEKSTWHTTQGRNLFTKRKWIILNNCKVLKHLILLFSGNFSVFYTN